MFIVVAVGVVSSMRSWDLSPGLSTRIFHNAAPKEAVSLPPLFPLSRLMYPIQEGSHSNLGHLILLLVALLARVLYLTMQDVKLRERKAGTAAQIKLG